MRGLWREFDDFFSSTSIHGFLYISGSQSMSTRFIWTIIVLAGFGVATYFLYNTVDGFSDKYVTTTVETRKIQDYPFPAVTFYPGEYNSKNVFLRNFLNEFEFTRYDEKSPLRDNERFINLYQWLLSPMHNDLFNDIEYYLTNNVAGRTFRMNLRYFLNNTFMHKEYTTTWCSLVALHNRNISLKSKIREAYLPNMYRVEGGRRGLSILMIRDIVGPIVKESAEKQNLTKANIVAACKDKNNKEEELVMMESMMFSFVYLYSRTHSELDIEVGAGDLATGPYASPLSHATHTLLTNLYNEMVNATLPASILQYSEFFALPDNNFPWWQKGQPNKIFPYDGEEGIHILQFMNITFESWRNYHYLWYTYYNNNGNFTLKCNFMANCTAEPLSFYLDDGEEDLFSQEEDIIIEGYSNSPPCSNSSITMKFKIDKICSIQKIVSENKKAFLKLMKFTKQSPVYLQDTDKYFNVSQRYGYIIKNGNKQVNNI